MPRLALAAVAVLALALGLLPTGASASPTGFDAVPDPAVEPPRVVVAPMDSGINPYHPFFAVEESSVTKDVLADFGVQPSNVFTLGDTYEADRERVWNTIEQGVPYHFTGTNIIGISFDGGQIIPGGTTSHGVGVAGSVVAANPEAILYNVQGGFLDEGEPHTFSHEHVDIVTMSYGLPASAGTIARVGAYEGVVEQGKLSFGAATNDPQVGAIDGTSGPWYEIGIAGITEEDGVPTTRTTSSGNVIDFVADFTQRVPYCSRCNGTGEDDGFRNVSGTSFATPRSAGIASAIILDARRTAGHVGGITEDGLMVDGADADGAEIALTNWDVRRALEEAAFIPGAVPVGFGSNLPVNQTAPYVQIGWGVLTTGNADTDVIPAALEQLLGDAQPVKSAATCDYMTQYMNARYVFWDANPDLAGGGSGSFGQTNVLGGSPYIACPQGTI